MKRLIITFILIFICTALFSEAISTGSEYYYFEYDGSIIWNNPEPLKIIEIILINNALVKIVIDIPYNKAGAFNTFTWYLEYNKSITITSNSQEYFDFFSY